MNRTLPTTAIAVLLLAAPAIAQEQSGDSGSTPSGSSSMETGSGDIFAQVPADPQMQFGSDLIGSTVYSTMAMPGQGSGSGSSSGGSSDSSGGSSDSSDGSSSGDSSGGSDFSGGSGAGGEQQSIGEINDLIVTQDGQVEFVIVGVGGFLGIGERDVAVNMGALEFMQDPENQGEYMITIPATQQAIENAPEFDRAALEGGQQGGGSGSGSGSGSDSGSGSGSDSSSGSGSDSSSASDNSDASNN